MAKLKAIIVIIKVALSVGPVMAIQWLLVRFSPLVAEKFAHKYMSWLNHIMNVQLTIKGAPVKGKPCLMVANHGSWQDIVFLGAATPVSFVAKKEVSEWPVMGTLARLGGTVFVDRERRRSANDTKNEMQERFESGDTLVLFPEGTTNNGQRLLPFKSALFGASQMKVDGQPILVQPVTVAYKNLWGLPMASGQRTKFSWEGDMALGDHVWNVLTAGPADITICFHKPMTVEETGGRKQLARICEQTISRSLAEELSNCN